LVKSGMDARVANIGPLIGLVLALSAAGLASKVAGCGLGARLAGLTTQQSLVVGAGMIARGEVSLVIARLALSAGLIPQPVFSATVVVVLITALATPPLLRSALRGSPTEDRGALLAAPDSA